VIYGGALWVLPPPSVVLMPLSGQASTILHRAKLCDLARVRSRLRMSRKRRIADEFDVYFLRAVDDVAHNDICQKEYNIMSNSRSLPFMTQTKMRLVM
jgi:hypothetical protein